MLERCSFKLRQITLVQSCILHVNKLAVGHLGLGQCPLAKVRKLPGALTRDIIPLVVTQHLTLFAKRT
jgi:hypothetical protein